MRKIAHEFYAPLPRTNRGPYVTYKFITDSRVGMEVRAKRIGKGEKLDERIWVEMALGAQRSLRLLRRL